MKDERKERVASNLEVDKALKEAMRKYNSTFKRLAEE